MGILRCKVCSLCYPSASTLHAHISNDHPNLEKLESAANKTNILVNTSASSKDSNSSLECKPLQEIKIRSNDNIKNTPKRKAQKDATDDVGGQKPLPKAETKNVNKNNHYHPNGKKVNNMTTEELKAFHEAKSSQILSDKLFSKYKDYLHLKVPLLEIKEQQFQLFYKRVT